MFEDCFLPASSSLRLQTHIFAFMLLKLFFSDLLVGWWLLFCPTQWCPDVNIIQTRNRTALINTSWFVSGSSKASVNNLEKRIRSNLKQASLSGKQLATSLIAWKNIFFSSAAFFRCILYSCSCNSIWRWMSPDVIWASNILCSSPHPMFFPVSC